MGSNDTTRTKNVRRNFASIRAIRVGILIFLQFVVNNVSPQCNDSMTTHGAVAFIMQEQHTDVSIRFVIDVHNEGTVLVVMTTWFVHQHGAVVVKMFTNVTTFLQNCSSLYVWVTGSDYAQGFTTRVHVSPC